ncbi:hypothetical protein DFH07DRAFT_445492 [Mycena maculata]|uniref:Uncharacterized protein n=1 Tax=Mycena maculata TaxID=230809 RepID=A0AAD7JCE4_9AGAR|nr:hypothetical protein DFH07DRAFT_445492 [Mycena maculata]
MATSRFHQFLPSLLRLSRPTRSDWLSVSRRFPGMVAPVSSMSASRKLSEPGTGLSLDHAYDGSSYALGHRRERVMPSAVTLLSIFLLLSGVVLPCRAQTSVFQWQFSGNVLSSSLPSCQTLNVNLTSSDPANNTHGVPPFYMIAFPSYGTPSTMLIGTDESQLAWVVNQPAGTQLMLEVVDSQGNSGGVPPNLFTVSDLQAQTTQCIPAASTAPPFTVTANVTDVLDTCKPWALTVTGGINHTLLPWPSSTHYPLQMPLWDDMFVFVDRASRANQLLAAFSDSTGRWAAGTPVVFTEGTTNTSCIGLSSFSTNSNLTGTIPSSADPTKSVVPPTQSSAPPSQSSAPGSSLGVKKSHPGIIAGVVVSFAVLLAVGAVGALVYRRRRKLRTPQPFTEIVGQVPHTSPGGYSLPSGRELWTTRQTTPRPFEEYLRTFRSYLRTDLADDVFVGFLMVRTSITVSLHFIQKLQREFTSD